MFDFECFFKYVTKPRIIFFFKRPPRSSDNATESSNTHSRFKIQKLELSAGAVSQFGLKLKALVSLFTLQGNFTMFHNKTAKPAYAETSFRYNSSRSSPNINITEQNHGRIYLPTPMDPLSKHCLFVSMAVVAVLGFVGNVLVAYYLKSTQKKSRLRRNRNFTSFTVRLNYYIRSLVISDTLCSVVTLPLFYLQIFSDVFQKDWHCKLERYFYFVFPCVTINNLLVITVERLSASWQITRRFSFSTVQRLVILAWLSALLITLVPVANFRLVQYDLNATHFTVTCRFDNSVPRSRAAMLIFTVLEFILPSVLLIVCNIWVMKQAWQKLQYVRRSIGFSRPRYQKVLIRKGIFMLVAITFAFIIPYVLSFTYVMFNSIAKPHISFRTDYIIRCSGGILVTANGAVNVIIYTLQLPNFRDMLKNMAGKLFVCKVTSAEQVTPKAEENIIPHNCVEALNADFKNIEEVKDKQLKKEAGRDKAPCEEDHELEERRTPPIKREKHVACNVEEVQAVVHMKKEASCQIVITADIH